MRAKNPLARVPALLAYLALGAVFFGSLGLAAAFCPGGYDWRRDVMSDLAEPRFNPHAYLVACAGLAGGGLLLLPFPALLRARLAAAARGTTRFAGFFLYLAAALLTLAGIVPGHTPGLGRSHETLAHAYGVALSVAMLGYVAAARRLPRRFALQRFAGIVLIVLPFAGFGLSQLALHFASRLDAPADYRAFKSWIWNSLALWEWIAGLGTYLYLGLLLTLPRDRLSPAARAES